MEIKRCRSGIVEDKELHVHLTVLALCTPVFEKMFTSEFQEKGKNEFFLPNEWMNECEWSEPVASDSISLCIRKANQPNKRSELSLFGTACRWIPNESRCKEMRGFHHNNGEAISRLWEDGRERIIQELVFSQTYNLHKLMKASQHCSGWYF